MAEKLTKEEEEDANQYLMILKNCGYDVAMQAVGGAGGGDETELKIEQSEEADPVVDGVKDEDMIIFIRARQEFSCFLRSQTSVTDTVLENYKRNRNKESAHMLKVMADKTMRSTRINDD